MQFLLTIGNNAMSRNHFTLGMLAAAFTLLLIASEADARGFRNLRRNNGCCQSSYSCGYGHGCGYRQHYHRRYDWGNSCHQQVSYARTTGCCVTRPTCCDGRPACATTDTDMEQYDNHSRSAMRQAPAPAPAPALERETETDQSTD